MIINVSFLLFLFIYATGLGKARPEKHGHRTAAMNAKDISNYFFSFINTLTTFCLPLSRPYMFFTKREDVSWPCTCVYTSKVGGDHLRLFFLIFRVRRNDGAPSTPADKEDAPFVLALHVAICKQGR